MRPGMIGLMAIVAATGVAGAGEVETGLVAHYTFDEGGGAVLKDHSGRGHHGTVKNAQWVKSPRGYALSFNGKDSEVIIPSSADLNIAGDATLEAWVKTTSDPAARDCLIFGDDASLVVNRNISVCIDQGELWVFQGNDSRSANFVLKHKFDATWTHLAVIFEQPRCFLYLNGVLSWTGPLDMPLSKTKGGNRRIGGWWAGRLKGEIDEVRLYDRAIAGREVLAHFSGKPTQAEPTVQLSATLSHVQERITLDAICPSVPGEGLSIDFAIVAAGQDKPVTAKSANLAPTRPRSERAAASAQFATSALPVGEYEGRAGVKDAGGKQLAAGRASFVWPRKPAWWGSKKGFGDNVLPPYAPVKVQKSEKGANVSVWGRTYQFGDAPFLTQVESRSADLLAAPMRLIARVSGQDVQWKPRPALPGPQKPAAARIHNAFDTGKVEVQFENEVEYDGYVSVRWVIRPREAVEVDQLSLEIPFKPEHALYLYTWPTASGGYSGAIKQDYAGAFRPIIWIGDNERGLSWFCESRQNWSNSDASKVFQVVRKEGQVVLRLNLIDRPTRLAAGGDLKYAFCFQATPLKPIERDGWDYAFVRVPWYGRDYDVLTQQIDGKPAMRHLKEAGCKTLGVFNWTPVLSYPDPLGNADRLRALVKSCHEHDIKLVVYLGFLFSERAPEYAAFTDDVTCIPRQPFPDKYPDQPMQLCDTVCLRGPWQDALVHNVASMMEEYDIDGIYLDTTTLPFECQNERHGCGYRDADGRLHSVYPIASVRQTFRRFYKVVKARKPEGIVDAHVWDCVNGAALAFATNYWNGEQLGGKKEHIPDVLSLDRFRAEFMGVNWGVPADFLHYQAGEFARCHAISLLHDVLVRPALLDEIALESKIYKLAARFGRRQAKFLPYWSNADYVKVSPADCRVSLYKHPSNGVLAIVSNLGKAHATIALELDLEKLALPKERLSATDGLTGRSVTIHGNKLEVPLASLGWQYIWIKPR